MNNTCLRCGYVWATRSLDPIRCPRCKSVRWNREVVKDSCKRCGAEWIQRGGTKPKYCPVCHSSMWDSEIRTFTCPKCGKTRMLRSNSRENLCPECDLYNDRKSKLRFLDCGLASGIRPIIHLWSDGKGKTLNCVDDGSGRASLYDNGRLLGEINIASWCKNSNLVFEIGPKLSGEKYQSAFALAAEKILFVYRSQERKYTNIESLRGVSPLQAEVIGLYESGMKPVSIALRLGIPFTDVMDMISTIPAMSSDNFYDRRETYEQRSEYDYRLAKEREKA